MASVVNTYARAFAEVVLSKRLDEARILAEIEQMAGLVRENKQLREVWEAPSIPGAAKTRSAGRNRRPFRSVGSGSEFHGRAYRSSTNEIS